MKEFYLHIYSTILILLYISSSSLLAYTIPDTPPNPYGEKKQYLPHMSTQKIENPTQAKIQVRIGLKIEPLKKLIFRSSAQKKQIPASKTVTKYTKSSPLLYTLRSRIHKVSHFYLEDYHVETRPISFSEKEKKADFQIVLYKLFGRYNQLEEEVGSLTLSGDLVKSSENIFILQGSQAKRIRNKQQEPLLDIVAGFTPQNSENSNISPEKDQQKINPNGPGPSVRKQKSEHRSL